jgi:signal transduction histidine kinase
MEPVRPSLRLFLLFLLVAVPPLAAFAAVAALEPAWLDRFGAGTVLLVAGLLTALWAGTVSIVAGRGFLGDLREVLTLAERGRPRDGGVATPTDGERGGALERLGAALDERNRQIADLAAQVRRMPIQADPTAVAHAVVRAARSVTHDPTWTLAILRSPAPDTLRTGEYAGGEAGDEADIAPLTDVHRWASTAETADTQDGDSTAARVAGGPWGAFAIVEVVAGEELRAILLAPWEGRPDPSRADLELLRLLGQQSATAIEHALLVGQLREQADELSRLSAIQVDFLRGVTHDLQTPLTSIGAVATELRETRGLGAEARADLDTIVHQADRLRRMVAQLLAVSRLEAGALQPRVEVFRPEPLVRRTWDALRESDRPFQVTSTGPAYLVVGDPDRLEQVLWALLDNAVKYSRPGSRVEVALSSRQQNDSMLAEIEIRDQGMGMSPEAAAQAFDQFFRADSARRMVPDGSGVGLHAARGLVRAMGGEIALRSELGEGTTLTVTLPAEPVEEPTEPAAEALD